MAKSFKKGGGLLMPVIIIAAVIIIGYSSFTNREGFQTTPEQIAAAEAEMKRVAEAAARAGGPTTQDTSTSLPPPGRNVTNDTLIPVGIQINCKLSDIHSILPEVYKNGYTSSTSANSSTSNRLECYTLPPRGIIMILDQDKKIVWSPTRDCRVDGKIKPFPNTNDVKDYIIFTNSVLWAQDMFPVQSQPGRDALDNIIGDFFKILINLSVLNKEMPLAPQDLTKTADFLSKVKFKNIVYKKYGEFSSVTDGFRNNGMEDDIEAFTSVGNLYDSKGNILGSSNNIMLIAGAVGLLVVGAGAFMYVNSNK